MMTLRPATLDDAPVLFAWRNDPETRRASRNEEPVTWEGHVAWLKTTLTDTRRRLFIAEHVGHAVGTGRVDLHPHLDQSVVSEHAELSLTIAPEFRGCGYARQVIDALVQEAASLGVKACEAFVKPDNAKSLRAFYAAGFSAPPVRLTCVLT